ncbi:MAG: hypothetical protein WCD86_18565, partial [Ktedonobacteraceae bacterium]
VILSARPVILSARPVILSARPVILSARPVILCEAKNPRVANEILRSTQNDISATVFSVYPVPDCA